MRDKLEDGVGIYAERGSLGWNTGSDGFKGIQGRSNVVGEGQKESMLCSRVNHVKSAGKYSPYSCSNSHLVSSCYLRMQMYLIKSPRLPYTGLTLSCFV